jgi:hypothetical protein
MTSAVLFQSTMSSSKSSLLSQTRRFLSRFRGKRTVHALGLLGTYDIQNKPSADDDIWMAIDFIALRQLLGARDDLSKWYCGTPIRVQRDFLLGDPAYDRIVFDPPLFETVLDVKPKLLASEFLSAVAKASSRISAGDILVIVLAGHGDEEDHSLVVGEGSQRHKLEKEELECCVRGTKGDILVISTACFSGSWTSSHWTLLAAAGPDEHATSMVVSGSGECPGGFFTNALLAEYADKFNIRPPYPGSIDNNGHQGRQRDHHTTVHPSPLLPKRNMQDVINWIHRFRDDIGRTYPSANITFHPCRRGPHHFRFASLISASAPIHQLTCVPPSSAADHASIRTAHLSAFTPPQNMSVQTSRTLSKEEEETLVILASNLLDFMPPSIASEKSVIIRCWQLIHGVARGREPLEDAERSKLYSDLVNRVYQRELALAIAGSLGWDKAVRELGGPGGKQMQMDDMVALRREAEASGCLVSILVVPVNLYTRWAGAAGWLARVWEASGRPIVSPNEWARAVQQGSS